MPSLSSAIAEANKEVKEKRDGKAVKGVDEKELHDRLVACGETI